MNTTSPIRVAIVTGSSRGIGREVALRLADEGHAVVVNYAGNADLAEEVVRTIADKGGQAIAVRADVADEVAVAAMFDAAEQHFGGIDVVVNSAGRMVLGPLAELDLDAVDAMHRTNIRGTFVVDQQAARRVRDGGAIINFSTSVTRTSFPNYSAYVASKAAVEGITLILARELRGRNITVNSVAPGPTATDLFLNGKSQDEIDRLANAVPLERLGMPSDIAELVNFLASPAGHWVNGQDIKVNGGLV
ncbi:MAG TPA: SDR family oxidoreductase [Pseudonocardiaceae bacterium]|jgi:3-oxoacyl-[acyl-carrier protein] reductase|nr:SDR family oxidoreductase [Pseudonocardiaceae bacterium]